MKIAIVTGASSGMGREFLLALDRAEAFDEIWAVARRADRLEALRSCVRTRLRPIAADLATDDAITLLRDLLQAATPQVAILVNAAGYGRFGRFRDLDAGEQLGMIDLNVRALTRVTGEVLPYMGRGGRIYNIGSLSSFQPVPYMDIYAASKAYVLSYSRSLNVELSQDGIRVIAVCPGWVRTEFFNRAATDNTITYYNRYYDAPDVVRKAMQDMEKGKDVSVLGLPIRFQVLLVKLLPHRLVMKIWCGQQKQNFG